MARLPEDVPQAHGAAFEGEAVGRENGHSMWNLGAGVGVTYKRFDFGVNYDYVGMSDFASHRVSATAGIRF